MEVRHQVSVSSAQVDELGHLNHSYAVQILEYARDEWYAAAGLWEGRRWSGEENLQTIVLNINVNYRQECFLDEPLTVVIAALDGGNKSFRLTQKILKQDGSVAIDALVTSVVMCMDTHETIEIPRSIRSYLPPRQP
jgi:acyl-CoA thioesterase FadM